MPYIILFCILLGLVLLWQSTRQRRAAGLPGGQVVYADTSHWAPVEKPLYAPNLGLTGKPDYLVQQGEYLIPVEVKSTSSPYQDPFDAHIYQLAAYCLLVAHVYKRRPPHGILHYTPPSGPSRTFAIPFTPELEADVLSLITEIQGQSLHAEISRSHTSPARCAHCGYHSICDQAL